MFSYIPHGHCYLWQPTLVGLHGMADGLMAIAYFSLSFTVFDFRRRREDLPYPYVFGLFSAFIAACGINHLLEIWTLWYPIYWTAAGIKAIAALISGVTAVVVIPIVPQALALPSPQRLCALNQTLQHEIAERQRAEHQLELQAVVTRTMAEGICLVRVDNGNFVYANPKFEQMFGYESGELDGQHVSIVNYATQEVSAEEVNEAIRSAVLANQEATYEVHNVKKDRTPFWCQATTSVFNHPDYGQVLVAVHQDISDRKEAEAKLKASLQEKELLLKEVYHRVKNNLQIVHSLINLQVKNLSDAAAISVLKDSQSRIRAMALVHEKLYDSNNLVQVELADYVKSLAQFLSEFYGFSARKISINVDVAPCELDIETALPCGLILTELLSNSFKYAFPNEKTGIIAISSITVHNQVSLIIQDNGIGLPPNFDLASVSTLGLILVRNLSKQIGGDVLIVPQSVGTQFQILFPLIKDLE